jgi:predicted RNA-binding Zn-ribbon protein involved in translation (DUF1610 family)
MTAVPEQAMQDDANIPTPVALDAEGRVAEDVACIRCGYNLRTLYHDGRCPECDADVIRSNMVAASGGMYICPLN